MTVIFRNVAREAARKTYASRSAAEKALRDYFGSRFPEFGALHFIISTTEEGRFFPVVLPTEAQTAHAFHIARHGFLVVRV